MGLILFVNSDPYINLGDLPAGPREGTAEDLATEELQFQSAGLTEDVGGLLCVGISLRRNPLTNSFGTRARTKHPYSYIYLTPPPKKKKEEQSLYCPNKGEQSLGGSQANGSHVEQPRGLLYACRQEDPRQPQPRPSKTPTIYDTTNIWEGPEYTTKPHIQLGVQKSIRENPKPHIHPQRYTH